MDQIIPYCGPAPSPASLLSAWNFDPLPLVLCLAPLAAIAMNPRVGRGPAMLGSAALFLAFISPLCALTVSLFSARGLHHLVLLLVAAPALALAWPRALPAGLFGGFAGVSFFLWLWHLPAAYTLAWESPAFYWLMQAGLVASACAFWSGALHSRRATERINTVGALLALAGQMGLIGAVLTFSPRPLYAQHLPLAPAFGLDALTDQQLAGLIMWVPGMLPLALLGGLLLHRRWRDLAVA